MSNKQDNELKTQLLSLVETAREKKRPTDEQLSKLRSLLRQYPEILDEASLLRGIAERDLLTTLARGHDGILTLLEAECESLRNRLGYRDSMPLERLAVDSLILAWLRWMLAEIRLGDSDRLPVEQASFYERQLSSAQQRFHRSVATLDRLRRRPVVAQFNFAQQQIVNPGLRHDDE